MSEIRVNTIDTKDNTSLSIQQNNTTALTIDTSQNVGIGTTSPTSLLELSNSSGNTTLQMTSVDGGNTTLQFGDVSDASRGTIQYNNTSEYLRFTVNNLSEAMRIDSSGNVLVGKTAIGIGTEGVELRQDRLVVSRDGGSALQPSRLNSDGAIIDLYKDTTIVGSIGVDFTDNLFISGNSNHAGLNFGTASVVPYKNGANLDATIDWGSSATRFKDLYLSGSVYLGGTGSANALDDYEEGTWTPTYSSETGSFGSITYDTSVQGFYTKIGRMVHLMGFIRTDDVSVGTASSYLYLDGLPFTMLNGYSAVGVISRTGSSDWGGNIPLTLDSVPNASKLFIGYRATSTSNQTLIQVSDMDTGTIANRNALYFSITYQTT